MDQNWDDNGSLTSLHWLNSGRFGDREAKEGGDGERGGMSGETQGEAGSWPIGGPNAR